jgi:hypothetical protein
LHGRRETGSRESAYYYEFGAAAERWGRAQPFFDAKEYRTAARVLGGLVEEAPELVAPRLRAVLDSEQVKRLMNP